MDHGPSTNAGTEVTGSGVALLGGMTRRDFLRNAGLIAGATTAGPLLAACTSKKTSNKKAGGKIVIGTYQDGAVEVMKNQFLSRFTQDTGIQTEFLETDYNAWFEKAVNDAQSNAGAYDIYVLDDPWVPQFAGSGLLMSLTKLGYKPDPTFVPSLIELGYWPNRSGPVVPSAQGQTPEIYSLPIIGDTIIFCYRTDIFSTPPTTWNDIVSVAKAKADPSAKKYGWAFDGSKGNPAVSYWFPVLGSFGGAMFDDNWNVTFNDATGVEALEFQLSLLQYSPPGVAEFDDDQTGESVATGQTFAADLWTGWDRNIVDPSQSKVADKVGFGVPPSKVQSTSEIGIFIAGISRSAPNPDGALKFLEWFTSDDIQRDYARAGGVPVKVSNFTDPQAVQKAPFLPAVLDTLKVAIPRPRTPEWSHVEDILGTWLNQAYVDNGSKGAKAYLDTAAQQSTQVLQQAGYYS